MAGKATGERISGEVVQAIIAAASLGNTIRRTAKLTGVDRGSAKAIIERESATILQRKEALTPVFLRIAERGALRLEREIDNPKTQFRDVTVAAGVAVDKVLALTATAHADQNHLHLHLQSNDLISGFNDFLRKLPANSLASDALLDGYTEPLTLDAKTECQDSAREKKAKPGAS